MIWQDPILPRALCHPLSLLWYIASEANLIELDQQIVRYTFMLRTRKEGYRRVSEVHLDH